MSITSEKKEFIQYIAGGLSTLMNGSMLADEIYTSFLPWPNKEWIEDPTELYINDNILDGSSFSENKFCKAMETIDNGTLWELLTYFDNRDMVNLTCIHRELPNPEGPPRRTPEVCGSH